MDCNKDEAVRAKDFAEAKMQSEDFEGAKKFAVKAQNLYAGLENISQMLTTCSVHCSARSKIFGSEMDWYGILQVDKFSNEQAVKKQYRKLALVLHPDKNRFPGADGAFKLICEANALLIDPRKKHEYDSKIKVMSQANRFAAQNQQFNRQTSAQTRASNYFNSTNQSQASAYSTSAVSLETFWTSCPSCKTGYRYLRRFLNGSLWCRKCKKGFLGREMGAHGASVGTNTGQASEQNAPPKPEANGSVGAGQTSGTEAVDADRNAKKAAFDEKAVDSNQNVEKASGNEGVRGTNPTNAGGDSSEAKEDDDLRNADSKSKTRSKRFVEESDDSSYTKSDKEMLANQTAESSQVHYARRSSRKRGHVSYNEDEDDEFASPVKRSRQTESENEGEHSNAAKSKNVEEETTENKDDVSHKEDPAGEKIDADGPVDISSAFSLSDDDTTEEVSHCPDPEFSDFDQEREQARFKAGQFWACYDSFDGMPRFYARVKNVHDSPFELTFTWLEADPIHEPQVKWAEEELPVGCGRFKLGQTEKTSSLPTFSHQMHCEKGSKRNSFVIYPREGEVWAVFKDWDMGWRLEPESHQHLKYEVVEVLSDFDEHSGVEVIHMNKIGGFVSLFQRAATHARTFVIKPHELYRFSHRILCNKMTGGEKEGVPPGSYELDPASLPLNPEDLHCPYKTVVVENLDADSEEGGENGKSTSGKGEEIDADTLKQRRSPGGLNGVREKAK